MSHSNTDVMTPVAWPGAVACRLRLRRLLKGISHTSRARVKDEMDILGSLSLIVRTVFVDVKQH